MRLTENRDIWRDIATGIGMTCAIVAISVLLPVIGFFCALFIPLPVLFYRTKLGRANGSIIPVGTAVILAVVLGGIVMDIFFFLELMVLGFILSELFEKNISVEKTMLYACLTMLCTGVAGLMLYSTLSSKGIVELIADYVAKNLEFTIALYENTGASEEAINQINASLELIKYVFIRMLPALTVTSTLFITWTNLLLARPVLKAKSLAYPDFGILNQWKAPEYLIWGLIFSGALILIPEKGIKMIGINGLFVLLTIYFFQGIAIVSYFFKKMRFPRVTRIILYTLVAMQQLLWLVVIGFGLFDMWLDFRKLNPPKD